MAASIEYMVRQFLTKYNYDGLCDEEICCGCDMSDLMVCSDPNGSSCKAAYRFDCSRCLDGPAYNNDCKLNEGDDYMMSTLADYCHPVYVEVDG